MITTIKIEQETKEQMLKLDLAEKGKSFNTMLVELISFYERNNKENAKALKKYQQQSKEYDKILEQYHKDVDTAKKEEQKWTKLLDWAKTKGFKE